MEIRRNKDGILEMQLEKNKRYKILYHGYTKDNKYLMWYLDKDDNKVLLDNDQLKQVLKFVEEIEI